MKLPAGMAMPGAGDPFLAFDVDERHPQWGVLEVLFREWRASDLSRTEFTKKELDSARWLEIGAWHHGYPQPDEDIFGFREATYELSDACEACGMGMRQRAPFQMKGEPKWGRNSIMQLVWIHGELFVTPHVWATVFEPSHVACRRVLDRKGTELNTVVQLVVDKAVSVKVDGLVFERCERCGRTKYHHVTRGFFPALREIPGAPLVRTAEYFGSGGQADQCLLISQELARKMAEAGVRGASLKPVADST